jgi:hypothetical protein
MRTTIVVFVCCALFAAAGCKRKTMPIISTAKAELTASTGGRDLHVISDGGAWVNRQENQFTITLSGHEVVIDRERVLVDEKEAAKLRAEAKKFDLNLASGMLTLNADGTEILRTPLAK